MQQFVEFGKGEKNVYQYKIKKILKIVDGDTIDAEINLGFGVIITQRIRLKNINTAETRTLNLEEKKKGLEAKEWLKKELSREGEWIIETTKEDKYGRYLGILYCVEDPVTVNERMLNEGIAKPFMVS